MKIQKPKISSITISSLTNQMDYQDLHIINTPTNELIISNVTFDGCIFDKIDFKNIKLINVNMIDVIFNNCDLSNQQFNYLNRVEFNNCKLLGCNFNKDIKDILFNECSGRYLNFSTINLQKVIFVNNIIKDSYFNETNLINTIFNNNNLDNSELNKITHKSLDLSTNSIQGIKIDIPSLKNLIINEYQALDIISILGVIVH